QLRVEIGTANLVNIDEGFLALHHFLDVGLELVDLDALLADNDSGPRGMDVYLGLVGHPLDFDAGNARVVQALLDEVAQLEVLVEKRGVVVTREPARLPAFDDAEPQSAWM